MKKIIFFFSMVLLSFSLFSQEEVMLKNGKTIILSPDGTWIYKQVTPPNTFIDSRDGHVYKTVTIGTQVWMAENLAYKANSGCWAYKNDINNVAIYGYLYDWATANVVCPTGWHLPSNDEWTTLTNYLGGVNVVGGKMKETGTKHWVAPNAEATNESRFSALPGGYQFPFGGENFSSIGDFCSWWSSSNFDTEDAWNRFIDSRYNYIGKLNYAKGCGFSIRCIKDN